MSRQDFAEKRLKKLYAEASKKLFASASVLSCVVALTPAREGQRDDRERQITDMMSLAHLYDAWAKK